MWTYVLEDYFLDRKKGNIPFIVCCCLVVKSYPTLCNLRDCSPPGFLCPWDFSGKNTILEWTAISFSRGSSWLKNQTCLSCLADGFFTTEPPGKPIYCLITIKISGSSRDSGWINLWTIKLKANSNSIALFFYLIYWMGKTLEGRVIQTWVQTTHLLCEFVDKLFISLSVSFLFSLSFTLRS